MQQRSNGDAPLSEPERDQLRTLVARVGERRAQAELGVSVSALARGLAGLPLRGVTRTAIAAGLAAAPSEGAR